MVAGVVAVAATFGGVSQGLKGYLRKDSTTPVYTHGGTADDGSECWFPFTYKGKTFSECTLFEMTEAWCSVADSNGGLTKLWGYCNNIPTGSVKAAKKTGEEVETLGDDDHFFPWVSQGSEWYPICGHHFWDGNVGATNVCRALGFDSGEVERKGLLGKQNIKYKADKNAMPVGECTPGEPMNSCTAGGNQWDKFDHKYGIWQESCHAGEDVAFKVSCKGKTDSAATNSANVKEFICADDGQVCHCDGSVKFGMDGRWSEPKEVPVSIDCKMGNFGGLDYFVGNIGDGKALAHKQCLCLKN